jgi:hypothetical protein
LERERGEERRRRRRRRRSSLIITRTTERERGSLRSWAKAGKGSEGRSKATRSEGDDLEESAARALTKLGRRPKDTAKKVEKLREAKATTMVVLVHTFCINSTRA